MSREGLVRLQRKHTAHVYDFLSYHANASYDELSY